MKVRSTDVLARDCSPALSTLSMHVLPVTLPGTLYTTGTYKLMGTTLHLVVEIFVPIQLGCFCGGHYLQGRLTVFRLSHHVRKHQVDAGQNIHSAGGRVCVT